MSELRNTFTTPNREFGYRGLDHTIHFAHGFITCPYTNGQVIIDSVEAIPESNDAYITAEKVGMSLYNNGTTPIRVRCNWTKPLEMTKLVKKRIAVPLMIERVIEDWRSDDVAERWDTMRPYLLGSPHGSRSSLFVSQETALAMKKVYNAMNESGMYGPLRMD